MLLAAGRGRFDENVELVLSLVRPLTGEGAKVGALFLRLPIGDGESADPGLYWHRAYAWMLSTGR
jgi:hypothetical protein